MKAETKLKTEVTRIKKKLQMQITELEMSLDVSNKNNIELQKTIKKYSIQITVILTLESRHAINNCMQAKITPYLLPLYLIHVFFLGITSPLRRCATTIASGVGPIWCCTTPR